MWSNIRKYGLGATLAASPIFALAQATDPVVDSFTTVGGKVATYGAGLVGLAVIGVGFMVGVKYVKKARGAA